MLISLEEAADKLLSGDVVAIPTETVYGLAASYQNTDAIKKIYQLKNRPPQNPLILHVATAVEIEPFIKAALPPHFYLLARHFWPGPLTLVLEVILEKIPEIVRAGLTTQAFRVPDHPLTLDLLKKTGPLVAPSANLSGRPSAVTTEHVEFDFGKEFPVLDGGVCQRGVESTILIYKEEKWHLGRLGALPAGAFTSILGYTPEEISADDPLICPGQRYRHYAPHAKLNLVKEFKGVQAIIGFSDRVYPKDSQVIRWGSSQDPREVLSHLYETLRYLDSCSIKEVFVDVDFPDEGLWRTLKERLKKASGI